MPVLTTEAAQLAAAQRGCPDAAAKTLCCFRPYIRSSARRRAPDLDEFALDDVEGEVWRSFYGGSGAKFDPERGEPKRYLQGLICNSIRRFSSSAYSMGSSRAMGSTRPRTIIAIASSSSRPRDIR